MQALDIHGARSRNRTGTPLRAGDFKSYAKIKRAAALSLFSGPQFRLILTHPDQCFQVLKNNCGPEFSTEIGTAVLRKKQSIQRHHADFAYSLPGVLPNENFPCYSGFVHGGNRHVQL